MTQYDVEFIRWMPGRETPNVIDVQNVAAESLDEAIHRAGLSLVTDAFRVKPETFRIRDNGGAIVF